MKDSLNDIAHMTIDKSKIDAVNVTPDGKVLISGNLLEYKNFIDIKAYGDPRDIPKTIPGLIDQDEWQE